MKHYHNLKFKEIANDTKELFDNDEYEMQLCIENTKLYQPNSIFNKSDNPDSKEVNIEVIESTSTEASYELYDREGSACVLNFASANKPGGGWLNGSVAQEESLTRVSGLYYSLIKFESLYTSGEWASGEYYKDYSIFSPKVPFVKSDDGKLLDNPKYISVITSAAVNYNKVTNLDDYKEQEISDITRKRIKEIFQVALENDQRNLVLGAYGCGVFKNDPIKISSYFNEYLEEYKGYFDNIVFAIYDNTEGKIILNTFKEILL